MLQQVCPGLARVPTGFVNAYFIGDPDGRWAVVDAGLPGFAATIIEKAERRFGPRSRPEAVFLTHGHFDHAGNALALADHWGVPVYAHRLELPYLTGRSDYPPPDPTVGGAIGTLARFMPAGGRDLGTRLRALPVDATPAAAEHETGDLPGLEGWRWLHTPGHSPGHVAFFHRGDGTLLAGDAVATVDMSSYIALATSRQEIAAGGAPFICDWGNYARSLRRVADLEPQTLACGHGVPMKGDGMVDQLKAFTRAFVPPPRGRYVREPARTDERGVDSLPPKPADPLPWVLGAGVAGLALALALYPRAEKRSRWHL